MDIVCVKLSWNVPDWVIDTVHKTSGSSSLAFDTTVCVSRTCFVSIQIC